MKNLVNFMRDDVSIVRAKRDEIIRAWEDICEDKAVFDEYGYSMYAYLMEVGMEVCEVPLTEAEEQELDDMRRLWWF